MHVDARKFLVALGKLTQEEREQLIKKAGNLETDEEAFLQALESRISKKLPDGGFAGGFGL